MDNTIIDKIKSRLAGKINIKSLSEEILLDPNKLNRRIKKQKRTIANFKKDTNSDLKNFTKGLEKSFERDLEKAFSNTIKDIGKSNKNILSGSKRLSNFGTLDQSVDIADIVAGNISNMIADSLGSVLENGLNLAISNILTKKTTKTYETDRSKNISRDFGLSRKQKAAATSIELSSGNSNL